MGEQRTRSWQPALIGSLLGWMIGMVWWLGLLALLLGPSLGSSAEPGQLIQGSDRFVRLLAYAPVVGLPWAVVGLIVGAVNSALPGLWVPVGVVAGIISGGVYSVLDSPFDGWLFLNMLVNCLVGALAGLGFGILLGVRAAQRAAARIVCKKRRR